MKKFRILINGEWIEVWVTEGEIEVFFRHGKSLEPFKVLSENRFRGLSETMSTLEFYKKLRGDSIKPGWE